jgi:hypothetical protein
LIADPIIDRVLTRIIHDGSEFRLADVA